MATTKPRITVTLEPHTYSLLRSISEASKQPMSGIVSEFMEGAAPVFERMAVTWQKLSKAKTIDRRAFYRTLDDAEKAMAPLVSSVHENLDLFLGKVEEAAAPTRGARSAARGGVAVRTPPTNRGVTEAKRKPSKPSRGAASKPISKEKVFVKQSRGTSRTKA